MNDSIRPVALITGASSGLGMSFARQLSARGYDLILIARRKEKLIGLVHSLDREMQASVKILVADLANDAGLHKIEQQIRSLNRLDLLINNAGFGLSGRFVDQPIEIILEMIRVHNEASARLVHAALAGMIKNRKGAIINVSSISAFTPTVGNVMYSATKAFLVNFSKALQLEYRQYGIKVQALCPGFFHSGFHDVMRVDKKAIPGILFFTSDEVARRSLSALSRKTVIYVPGFVYQLAIFFARLPGLGEWLLMVFTNIVRSRREKYLRGR